MAKFVYVGDPNDKFSGPDVIVLFGIGFQKGTVVDVPDKTADEQVTVMKLQGNSHFVDLADKDRSSAISEQKKAQDKLEADKAKAEEVRSKKDEADHKAMEKNRDKSPQGARVTAENAPRPPGTVTRPPVTDPFQGRPVEERTRAEDHTSAGKTKS